MSASTGSAPLAEATAARRGNLRLSHTDQARDKGLIGPHQKMMLSAHTEHARFLDGRIKRLDQEIERRMPPLRKAVETLDGIRGVGRRTAEEVLAGTGGDMSRLQNAGYLASWAGLYPRNNESAGKRKSGCTRPGNPHLRTTLVEPARSATRTKKTFTYQPSTIALQLIPEASGQR